MKKKNTNEQVRFAKDLKEVTGIDILDGRNTERCVALHRTMEMKRGQEKREVKAAIEEYLRQGGKITVIS